MNDNKNITISVRVTAGSRTEKIEKIAKKGSDGGFRWKIVVREPAEQNRANERVLEILAREYRAPISAIRMIKGAHSTSKLFTIKT